MFKEKNVMELCTPRTVFRLLNSLYKETTQLKETLEPADSSWLHGYSSEKLNPHKGNFKITLPYLTYDFVCVHPQFHISKV